MSTAVLQQGWDSKAKRWDPTSPVGRLLAMVRVAAAPGAAAAAVGISRGEFEKWIDRGRQHRGDRLAPPGDQPFVALVAQLAAAKCALERELVLVLLARAPQRVLREHWPAIRRALREP